MTIDYVGQFDMSVSLGQPDILLTIGNVSFGR